MKIESIREQVREGNYKLKSHVAMHALKEGFAREDIVETILAGTIIEDYEQAKRVLICGPTTLSEQTVVYLHVVCEYADPAYVAIVTTYLPDESMWENPPFKRRKRRK
ncbi:MAG: DUF4258 domain-containing protein [Acidobacteriota bacterium]|nr:DUF4258 domain-containing protein [Acidobacteriota bacterium]